MYITPRRLQISLHRLDIFLDQAHVYGNTIINQDTAVLEELAEELKNLQTTVRGS